MKAGLTIEATATEVVRQDQAKQDYIFSTTRLEMVSYDTGLVLRLLDENGVDFAEPLDLNDVAHRQLGAYLNIPAKYYDRMLHSNPGLLAKNVNSWFQREPAPRMVRSLDGVTRAFLSNSYRRIDHLPVTQAVLPVVGEIRDVQFISSQVTDCKMYLKVLNPHLEAEVSHGDSIQAGIVVSNSEVGLGSFCVTPMIYRLRSQCGFLITDSQIRKIHKGRANIIDTNRMLRNERTLSPDDCTFLQSIQQTVRDAAVDEVWFRRVTQILRDAAGARMSTQDVPSVVSHASREFGITEAESSGVLNHLAESSDFTLYGLSNAVARQSQDVESYDRSTDLEGISYEMLTMTRQQWDRINQTAA